MAYMNFFRGLRSPRPFGTALFVPTQHGVNYPGAAASFSTQRLPTESIGNVVITMVGVKTGSEVRFISADGTIVASTDSSGSSPAFTLPIYPQGNSGNTLRVLVLNLGYEVLDFSYAIPAVSSTLQVFQRIDRNYRNPT